MTVNMSSMSLKAIGREVCLQARSLLGYQRILDPKGTQTLEESMSQKK